MVTSSSSTSNTSFDFTTSTNSNNLYGPFSSSSTSFSYLTSKEDALTQKNLISGMNMTIINPEEQYHDVLGITKKASRDLEIGVFGAEKYFNGDMDSDHSSRLVSPPMPNQELSVERILVGPKQCSMNSSETPSLKSESSWNSQSLLLQNKLEKRSNNKSNPSCNSYLQEEKNTSSNHKVSNKKSFLSNFGCRCVCSNRNSVDVVDEKRSSSGMKKIKTQLSFSEMKIHHQQQQAMLEQRKSLEIYGSPLIEKRIIQKKFPFQKKFPWEYSSSSKAEEHEFPVKFEEEEDGSVSDLSSNLFEIESLKGKAKGNSDPDSPNGYAPSEVSIEWSVVTASVADYSVMSECATSPVKNRSFPFPRIPIIARSNREPVKQRRGLLLGCKSHKSVRVSGDSYTSTNKTPSYVPRFPVEANPTSIETRRKISSSSVSLKQSPFLYI